MQLLDLIRSGVRNIMRRVAGLLNTLSGGRLSPNMVTFVGLLAHIPIAWLIAQGFWMSAGVWLIVFGLFDTLDGELARLQKRASPAGMFLDSVTDRVKEIILYVGIFYYVVEQSNPLKGGINNGEDIVIALINTDVPRIDVVLLVALLMVIMAGSILTSYINAWGEAVMSRAGVASSAMNKAFRGGLGSFEIRMSLIILGLLTHRLSPALLMIGLLVSLTIIGRMRSVLRELRRV